MFRQQSCSFLDNIVQKLGEYGYFKIAYKAVMLHKKKKSNPNIRENFYDLKITSKYKDNETTILWERK